MNATKHTNPDGSIVDIFVGAYASIGASASIGAYARIGNDASIGARASIGNDASIGARASIGDGASIGAYASIGNDASIGARASIGDGASIGARASIGDSASIGDDASIDLGESLHYRSPSYYVDIYRGAGGVATLSYGCETLPLAEWTPDKQAELCSRHGPDEASSLARAVRTAEAFFGQVGA